MSTIHLDKLLNPASIVVIGASARAQSPGLTLTRNVLDGGYQGELHLVNPRYKEVLGRPCYRSLKHLPSGVELAIILAPERIMQRTLIQCARYGINVAIVMSAVTDSRKLHHFARELGIRLLGPYCAGVIRPHLQLNATYSRNKITAGSLAVVSQSASLGGAILDWAESSGVGFSALLSTGVDTDISLADLLDLLAEDPHTRAILVYLDRVNNARSFMSAISAAARIKPVVLLKSTQEAARYCDALTRTGQVQSSDHVFQSALSRAGVVRIRTFSNLFAAAKILTSRIRTRGKRLAIISNGAAPAMLACERIESKGFQLAPLSAELAASLDDAIEGQWSQVNPLVLREPLALADNYRRIIQHLQSIDACDAILVIYVPDSRNDPTEVAEAVIECLPGNLPVLTCWMGDASVSTSRERFATAQVATFRTPESATDGFDFLHRYFITQQLLLQLPNPASRRTRANVDGARQLVVDALNANERILGPQKTRALLKFLDIDVLDAQRATHVDQAIDAARAIGYPVAVKLVSPNVAFKASVIGTQLSIQDDAQLRQAFEKIQHRLQTRRPDAEFRGVLVEKMHEPGNHRSLAINLTRDPSFGPVLSVGIGGDLTTLVQTRAVQLPPLNQFLIDDMLASREIAAYLGEFRHRQPIGQASISHVLRQLSELACELPEVFSVDINPLRVSADRAVAMEVHVVLERNPHQRRYAHLAIHPYPWQWRREVSLKEGRQVLLRPIRPEDGESIRTLVRNMSAESRYFRFMHAINELSPQMVAQFTKLDYDRQMAFVAEDATNAIVGVSRYATSNDGPIGEFAISVADNWQGFGLASALMRMLIEHATEQGLQMLRGDVLRSNHPMQGLMQALNFQCKPSTEDNDVLIYTCTLPGPTESATDGSNHAAETPSS